MDDFYLIFDVITQFLWFNLIWSCMVVEVTLVWSVDSIMGFTVVFCVVELLWVY